MDVVTELRGNASGSGSGRVLPALYRVDKWPAGIFAHCLEIYEHRMNDEVQVLRA